MQCAHIASGSQPTIIPEYFWRDCRNSNQNRPHHHETPTSVCLSGGWTDAVCIDWILPLITLMAQLFHASLGMTRSRALRRSVRDPNGILQATEFFDQAHDRQVSDVVWSPQISN